VTVYCLGSINADVTYRVARLARPGETIVAQEMRRGLGGKGANQSVAAARAGARVVHIGMVGAEGDWCVEELASYGVECRHVAQDAGPSGHAIIHVDAKGENVITVFAGANARQDLARIEAALGQAGPGDWLLLQNETSHQQEAAQFAQARGVQVAYSAAPFEAEALRRVLPYVSLLLLNEGEFAALGAAGIALPADCATLVTQGAAGAEWRQGEARLQQRGFAVKAVDSTGAGDCFAGYVVAGLEAGRGPEEAMEVAAAAAALSVTRPGAAGAVPDRAEVERFLSP